MYIQNHNAMRIPPVFKIRELQQNPSYISLTACVWWNLFGQRDAHTHIRIVFNLARSPSQRCLIQVYITYCCETRDIKIAVRDRVIVLLLGKYNLVGWSL
jgi:hypothetical protein